MKIFRSKKIENLEGKPDIVKEITSAVLGQTDTKIKTTIKKTLKPFEKYFKLFDVNDDGIVNSADIKDPRFWKVVLVVIGSIIGTAFLNVLSNGLINQVWEFKNFLLIIEILIGPFIIGVFMKSTFDDYDKRLAQCKKNQSNVENRLIEEKQSREGDKITHTREVDRLNLDHASEVKRLELVIELKTQYIDLKLDETKK